MRTLIVTTLVSTVALASSASARADIDQFGLFRVQRFQQTTSTPSSTPVSFDCELHVDASDATTMTGGTVTWSGPDSPGTITFLSNGFGTNGTPLVEYQWASASFATQSDLDTHCPVGTYTFNLVNGGTSLGSADFTATASNYTTSLPGIDPASFSVVGALNPTQTVTIATIAHAPSAGTQFTGTWLDVADVAANTTVASGFTADAGVLAIQIDGGTLEPAHAYRVDVFFSDRVLVDNVGFGSASTESAFDRTTQLAFATLLADGGAPPSDAGAVDATTGNDAATAEDAAAPADSGSGSSSGGGSGGSSGSGSGSSSGGGSGSSSGATTVPSAPIDSGTPAATAPAPSDGGGGLCAFTGGPRRHPGPLFVVLGAAGCLLLRRRRARVS